MKIFVFSVLLVLAILIGVYLYRVLQGPDDLRSACWDSPASPPRLLLVLMGVVFERVDMFIDISTGYALLNLVGAIAVAKYLEQKGLP